MEVSEDHFVAIVSDRTNPALADEQVTLELEEVTSDDIPLLKPGAVFYWSIGYADYPGRPRVRESRVRFRRIPGMDRGRTGTSQEGGGGPCQTIYNRLKRTPRSQAS